MPFALVVLVVDVVVVVVVVVVLVVGAFGKVAVVESGWFDQQEATTTCPKRLRLSLSYTGKTPRASNL